MYEFIDELYREHSAELTAALAVSTNDQQAAEDLAHEVFVRAMDKQDHLLEHPNPRAWLFRTGYNLAGKPLEATDPAAAQGQARDAHPLYRDVG